MFVRGLPWVLLPGGSQLLPPCSAALCPQDAPAESCRWKIRLFPPALDHCEYPHSAEALREAKGKVPISLFCNHAVWACSSKLLDLPLHQSPTSSLPPCFADAH